MLKSFELSSLANDSYAENFDLGNGLYFNYNENELFTKVEYKDDVIFVYGYCFDVRSPPKRSSGYPNLLIR